MQSFAADAADRIKVKHLTNSRLHFIIYDMT